MKEHYTTERKAGPSLPGTRVEVLSTFVADPVLAILQYWFNEFQYQAEFLPTNYGQIFQRLYAQDNNHHADDIHLVLFAVRDLVPEKDRLAPSIEMPHANVLEFVKALNTGVATRAGIWIIIRCPDPPADTAGTLLQIDQQAAYIAAQIQQLPGAVYIDATDLGAVYDIKSCFDDVSDRHAHIPYTDTYYAAIGTAVFRAIRARLGQVYKLIITDCDGTLWDGVCGEIKPDELSILPHHVWLHKFLQSRKSEGTLLALCSQNTIDDVHAVFTQREDLGLMLADFTNSRINWKDKADNIRELARELNIALDSVIFLENDPVQRNLVSAALPRVLIPDLPANSDEWPTYLQHIWAFDSCGVTGEAGKRTSLYREHAARENVRSSSASLSQFLSELRLQVSIEPTSESDVPRIFELVNRVTQFNVSGNRPTESDIRELILNDQGEWLVARVEDRFGDYGLVGAMSIRYATGYCVVDSFLLSCRALGRGVENQMLGTLGKRLLSNQISEIRFSVAETRRNQPAIDYLNRLGMSASDLRTGSFRLDTASTEVQPDDDSLPGTDPADKSVRAPDENVAIETRMMTAASSGEAEHLLAAAKSVQDLVALFNKTRLIGEQAGHGSDKIYIAPRNETEKIIVGIFQDLLGYDSIGIDEEFFDVGGHSLLVMRLLSRISAVFGVDLPIRMLFTERLTIENLASIVEASSTPEENRAELDEIKNALDTLSDEEIAELFSDLGPVDNNEN